MRRFPYVKRHHRSGNWTYFRRIPVAVRGEAGAQFFERSLRTADLKKISQAWSEANREFEQLVQARLPLTLQPCQSLLPTPEAIHWLETSLRVYPGTYGDTSSVLATEPHRVRVEILKWAEKERYKRAQSILNDPGYRDNTERFEAECKALGACGWTRDWLIWCPPLMKLTSDIIMESGLSIPPMHQSFYPIQQMVEAEFRKILEDEKRWREYDFEGMPERAPNPPTNAKNAPNGQPYLSLQALVELYISTTSKPRKTASKLRMVSRYIDSIHGSEIFLHEITKSVLITLQTDAKKIPARLSSSERKLSFVELAAKDFGGNQRKNLSSQAIRAWFNLLSGCFSWALSADLLDKNPTIGIKPKVSKLEHGNRSSFDDDDLRAIFSTLNYPRFVEKRPSQFWLPLLALCTGARLNELGQLAREDIKTTPIPVIRITDLSDNPNVKKRLKNVSSRREVPIHPSLIEVGFLEFVSSVKGVYLFEDLPHSTDNDAYEPTKSYSQYFGRYLKRIGVKTSEKTFHSFRHTFIDMARHNRIDGRIISAIVGHESSPELQHLLGSSTTMSYGRGNQIVRLCEEIARIELPIQLPHWAD